jgi:1-acyl-sn-glycerol-3-phosphate acyltransferase
MDGMQSRHRRQRVLGWLVAPLWVPLAGLVLKFYFGYRISGLAETRREFARIRNESNAPLLICPNHLTLIDSFLIAWALSPTWRFVLDFDALPWNTPEETNFATSTVNRTLAYLAKCIPIRRGGSREDVAEVLGRVSYLLGRGEVALLFPEGGRSRTGRVSSNDAGWGVGRIVGSVPGCRVLCVYMRGDAQDSFSDYPQRGDQLEIALSCIEPKSDLRGARRSRDLAQQIVAQIVQLEAGYFERRGASPQGEERMTRSGSEGPGEVRSDGRQ